MLELNPEAWRQLTHAYSTAEDIPELLLKLEAGETWINQGYGQAEPWFSLWSALCHQGDVYTASYAAVPHLVRIAQDGEALPNWQFFALTACIEIARLTERGPDLPVDLSASYQVALQALHELAYRLAATPWDDTLGRSVAAALLAAKGHAQLAHMILDISPDELETLRAQ